MKKYILLYIFLFLAVSAGFSITAAQLKSLPEQEMDMVEISRITQNAERYWGEWEKIGTSQYDFIVLDTDGNSVFKTDPSLPDTLHSGTKACFIRVDMKGKGYVMFDTDHQKYLTDKLNSLRAAVLIAGFVVLAAMLLFVIVLYTNIIHPFVRLSSFAARVADGKFDTHLPMDKGNIFGAFTESFDVMRQSLLEARQNEAAANQSKKELIAALSHDIKTPVTSIRLISELLQAKITDTAQLEKLKTIESKTEQINSIVDDLLSSTLEELGQFSVMVTDESSEVLDDILGKEDILITDIPTCLIRIDTRRMEQVFDNILSNSRKYAGTSIDVRYELVDSFLQVDINDYGNGVPETELDLLCTKFFRGTNAVESSKQGEGLGLYIAKILMDKMDGDLTCLNRSDGFTVRLLIKLS